MENLGEILKSLKAGQSLTGPAEGATSSSAAPPEAGEPEEACPRCGGVGWLRADVPVEHPDFGKATPCGCRLQRFDSERTSRLQKYSNLGALARLTFDNLLPRGRTSDPSNQERFRQAYEEALAYARKPDGWLVLVGPSGCGKTHLAAAIANYRIGDGHLAFFMSVPDLLDHLRSTFVPTSGVTYDALFEQVKEAPLLILDDLGVQSSTPWAREKLFQLLNHRFNARMPTIVTTASSLDGLDEKLRFRLTDPAVSRVLEMEKGGLTVLKEIDSLGLKLPASMTFESFDPRGMNLRGAQRQNLEEAFRLAKSFAETPEGWLVFTGGHGCGKTHLAAAIANYRRRTGDEVLFILVADLMDYLRSTYSPESGVAYSEAFEKVKTAKLLILDDFGEQATTPWAREKLYQIVNYRYNARLPTVFTSSLPLDQIEARIASRMADPRVSNGFEITAPDYRSGAMHPSRPPQESAAPQSRKPRYGRQDR